MICKIKELRENLRMSQQELAEKSGVSRGTISSLESGYEKNSNYKTLKAIANVLNTTVDGLFLDETV